MGARHQAVHSAVIVVALDEHLAVTDACRKVYALHEIYRSL